MAKTSLARSGENRGDAIQALGQGVLQTITEVGTGKSVIFFDISPVPDASTGNRIPMPPDTGMYWKCEAGDKVASHDGSAGGVISTAIGADTTVVWLFYDSVAGTSYVMECT